MKYTLQSGCSGTRVWDEYRGFEDSAVTIIYGHSKDGRPDPLFLRRGCSGCHAEPCKALITTAYTLCRHEPHERPPKNGPVATDERFDLTWQIMVKEEKVNLLREQAGCFVLLTNVPQDTPEAAGVSLCSET